MTKKTLVAIWIIAALCLTFPYFRHAPYSSRGPGYQLFIGYHGQIDWSNTAHGFLWLSVIVTGALWAISNTGRRLGTTISVTLLLSACAAIVLSVRSWNFTVAHSSPELPPLGSIGSAPDLPRQPSASAFLDSPTGKQWSPPEVQATATESGQRISSPSNRRDFAPNTAVPLVSPSAAKDYVGQAVSVTGVVEEISSSRIGTKFLNFDGKYPLAPFTVVVFASDATKVGDVSHYEGKRVTVVPLVRLKFGQRTCYL